MVSTTAPARIVSPAAVTTPATRPSSITRSSTAAARIVEIGLRRERRLHRLAIELAVGLGARPAHGRALAAVEQAELDAGRIRDPAHQAVQRIDLAHQMALADPADRGIAGHLADGLELVRQQQRARAERAPKPPPPRSPHGLRRSR